MKADAILIEDIATGCAMTDDLFKCILTGMCCGEDAAGSQALSLAIELARPSHAALSLYVFAPLLQAPIPMNPRTAAVWLAGETARLEKLTASARRLGSEEITRAGLDVVVERAASPFDSRSEHFVRLARVNDLTVLDAADLSDSAQRGVIEDVLFDSGRPLLVVPRHSSATVPQRIVIAWDGSARSARAVKDALPLLAGAQTVVAVTIEGEKDLSRMAPGADLAAYLTRHGIDCKIATLAATQRDAAERLRLFVAEEDFELIVMGAFVHSRFRQAILGGVTQSLLDSPPVALFMAH